MSRKKKKEPRNPKRRKSFWIIITTASAAPFALYLSALPFGGIQQNYYLFFSIIIIAGVIFTASLINEELKINKNTAILFGIFSILLWFIVLVFSYNLMLAASEKTLLAYLIPKSADVSKHQIEDGFRFEIGNHCFILPNNTKSILIAEGEKGSEKIDILVEAEVANGRFYFDANIYAKDGKKIAEIRDNQQKAFSNLNYETKNPDASTLQTIDKNTGKLVFSLVYINPGLIRIEGDFYTKNKINVKVNKKNVLYGTEKVEIAGFANICKVLKGNNRGLVFMGY